MHSNECQLQTATENNFPSLLPSASSKSLFIVQVTPIASQWSPSSTLIPYHPFSNHSKTNIKKKTTSLLSVKSPSHLPLHLTWNRMCSLHPLDPVCICSCRLSTFFMYPKGSWVLLSLWSELSSELCWAGYFSANLQTLLFPTFPMNKSA